MGAVPATLAKALSHSTRVEILMAMQTPRRRLSPVQYAEEQGCTVSHASYHFRKLWKYGLLEIVEEIPVRGAVEHIYEAVTGATAWADTWQLLPDQAKQNLSSTVLGGFVRAAGDAIDARTFEARDDSILAWSSVRLDEIGWRGINLILAKSLELIMAIGEEAEQRLLETEEEGLVASYCLASFESAPVPLGRE